MECKYSERIKNGARTYLKCTLNNDACPLIKYCTRERQVVNSTQAYECVRMLNYEKENCNE